MIKSKGIKILCYIIMGLVYLISAIILFSEIKDWLSDKIYSKINIIGSILLPFVVTVLLYPIFALANIDENLTLLNIKIDKAFGNEITNQNQPCEPQYASSFTQTDVNLSYIKQVAIDFVNTKYGTDISFEDATEVIKQKVTDIQENTPSTKIFKERVRSANTKEEVLAAILMHKATNS